MLLQGPGTGEGGLHPRHLVQQVFDDAGDLLGGERPRPGVDGQCEGIVARIDGDAEGAAAVGARGKRSAAAAAGKERHRASSRAKQRAMRLPDTKDHARHYENRASVTTRSRMRRQRCRRRVLYAPRSHEGFCGVAARVG